MERLKTFAELQKRREDIRLKHSFGGSNSEQGVLIKVGMATCGIASGAREVMKFIIDECERLAVDVNIKQTGCLGYCYAEPMIEVQLPGRKPKVFGYVDNKRASEIIEKYIIRGESVDGEILISFNTIAD